MAAPTSIDFQACFLLNTTPKKFEFTDLTDYAGQGTPTTEVVGVFKIVTPSGVTYYNNTDYSNPDIDVDVSTTSTTTISLPTLGNGDVEQGVYTITYTVRHYDGVTTTYVTKTREFDYCYDSPTVVVSLTANCATPLLTSKDSTNYVVNGYTPTITRTHKLYYPPSLGKAVVSGSAATLTTSTFYTQTHSSTVSSVLQYDISAYFCIKDTVAGGTENDIDCNNNLCAVFCCIENLYVRFKNAQNTNRILADQLQAKLEKVAPLLIILQAAYDCGDDAQVNSLTTDILNISECTSDCDCDGDTPVLVTGGGSGQFAVVVATNGLSVTSSVSGSTTTYTIGLSDDNLVKLNALRNTIVAAGSGITVTPTVAGDGTITYTVAATATSINLIDGRVSVLYSNPASPAVTINKTDFNVSGSNMVTPTIESVGYGTDQTGNHSTICSR